MEKINIAIAGGPCTGKSVLAAHLYSHLKLEGFDYDLVQEECRKLKLEFGPFNDPFERFYMWRQQEREEKRSKAKNGFITDKALFDYYVGAKIHATEKRHSLAVRELYRMCLELYEDNRYQLIVIANNQDEIPYKKDASRCGEKELARQKHQQIRSFVEHLWPDRILLIEGDLEKRTNQVITKVKELYKI